MDEQEDTPRGALPSWRNDLQQTYFADYEHFRYHIKSRSQTDIIIYINRAQIIWYFKRQDIVKISTFGSEFISLKIVSELTNSIRYKLSMIGSQWKRIIQ